MSSPFMRKHATGTGADIIIPMIKVGVADFAVGADWTPAAGDVKISKDGGASANIATLPVFLTDIGWKFVFSDAELTAARINVNIVDSATKAVEDQHFIIETYGNASAQHAFDLNLAEQLVALSATGKTDVNAEVVDVMKVDTIPEQSQGIPPANPTFEQAQAWFWATWRNSLTASSSEAKVRNDGGTVLAKAPLSDAAGEFKKDKFASGP